MQCKFLCLNTLLRPVMQLCTHMDDQNCSHIIARVFDIYACLQLTLGTGGQAIIQDWFWLVSFRLSLNIVGIGNRVEEWNVDQDILMRQGYGLVGWSVTEHHLYGRL